MPSYRLRDRGLGAARPGRRGRVAAYGPGRSDRAVVGIQTEVIGGGRPVSRCVLPIAPGQLDLRQPVPATTGREPCPPHPAPLDGTLPGLSAWVVRLRAANCLPAVHAEVTFRLGALQVGRAISPHVTT